MKSLTSKEIREKWVEFFTQKCERKHQQYPSASLVPQNPTLLLTAAGMVQFVPYFLGTKERPDPPRAISIQKCVRVGGKDSDLENIGRTSRHHSFFEMLGNFSIGDYFKAEVIPWAWQFVTQELGLPKDKLFVSVFAGDDQNPFDKEAYELWTELLRKEGISEQDIPNKIKKMGRKDNFWGPPGATGPCGPCSEIHYDRGETFTDPDERYLEIWNLVFMEFEKDEEGNFSPLKQKNIDTGAGLERIAMILQDKANSFETDEFQQLISEITTKLANHKSETKQSYKQTKYTAEKQVSELKGEERNFAILENLYIKIIADHLRCLTFLIADGVRPSNIGRGYVLRMIVRRAARFLFLLENMNEAFLYTLTDKVVEIYAAFYPELQSHKDSIKEICKKEEEQFTKTIVQGLSLLSKTIEVERKGVADAPITLSGDFVFDLYSTYGFPLEITQDLIKEKGNITIDMEAYEKAKEKHSEVSSTEAFATSVLKNKAMPELLQEFGETQFKGYSESELDTKLLAILDPESERVDEFKLLDLLANDLESKQNLSQKTIQVILEATPFYAESGGQLGEDGLLYFPEQKIALKVLDTKKIEGMFIHTCTLAKKDDLLRMNVGAGQGALEIPSDLESLDENKLEDLNIRTNSKVYAKVDLEHRRMSKAHHSSCHLLQSALRKVLGPQIQQAGSQVGPDYTRFDFNFDRKMTDDEIKKIETILNDWVQAELEVKAQEMSMAAATAAGALAFFEEKYADQVRVLSIGASANLASIELCGGLHVANTKEIALIKIASEGSVASGIRRIKLFVNDKAREFIKEQVELDKLKKAQAEAEEKAKQEAKARAKEAEQEALLEADKLISLARDSTLAGQSTKLLITEVKISDISALKPLAECIKAKFDAQNKKTIIFLGAKDEEQSKLAFIALVSDELTKEYKAGELVKIAASICGGGGGGRPNFAQAGAKELSKFTEALEAISLKFSSSLKN